MEGYIAIALLIIVLQLIFSVYQLRKYDRFIKELVKKHNTKGYSLYSETVKKFFKTVVVVIVTDDTNKVVEAYEHDGVTIFARFYPMQELAGQTLDKNYYQKVKNQEKNLATNAILKLMERNNTHVI